MNLSVARLNGKIDPGTVFLPPLAGNNFSKTRNASMFSDHPVHKGPDLN